MNNLAKYHFHRFMVILREGMPIMILIMLVFFGTAIIGFQKDSQRVQRDILEAVANTETIVAKQDETLEAIKDVATDNKLLSDQKTEIIICMLQVPVANRTTETVNNCERETQTRATIQAEQNQAPNQPSQPQTRPQQPQNSPQSTPPQQPSEPAPEPRSSIVPFVDEPILGCPLNICI